MCQWDPLLRKENSSSAFTQKTEKQKENSFRSGMKKSSTREINQILSQCCNFLTFSIREVDGLQILVMMIKQVFWRLTFLIKLKRRLGQHFTKKMKGQLQHTTHRIYPLDLVKSPRLVCSFSDEMVLYKQKRNKTPQRPKGRLSDLFFLTKIDKLQKEGSCCSNYPIKEFQKIFKIKKI